MRFLPITDQSGGMAGRIQLSQRVQQALDGLDPQDWKLSPVFQIDDQGRKHLMGLNLLMVPALEGKKQ